MTIGLAWIFVVLVAVVCATRIIAVAIALKGVPPADRATVLRGLAECFRWWRGGSPK